MRFDPAMIEELIASAPSEFTFHARNPENSQRIGGNSIAFGTVASPPNAADRDGGGRTGNRDFLAMAEKLGAAKVMAKPFRPKELAEAVAALLPHAA